ncbi:MFS transporter [Chitinophaga parva]|uniref:MFS transporter n=1 Tax=Chitinophaga parva TaxID=2169414 RepID=UPI00196A7309|nr:MFS transporter [Chitinophaga parva]
MTDKMVIPLEAAPAKAGRRQWVGLAALALPTLLVSMDFTVTYLALPHISAALQPGSAQLLWITDIYSFLQGGLLITMGTLGDRIGRRKLLLCGAVVFALASAMGAFSGSPNMLIVARGIMGMAGAAIMPSIVALVRSLFHDDKERAVAMGVWTTCFSTGTMLGPLLGGLLLDHYWWGSVFLIGTPVMLLFLVLAPRFLPEYRAPQEGRFDIGSAFLLLLGLLSLIYAVKRSSEAVAVNGVSAGLACGGILVLLGFLQRQAKAAHPLIDLQLFKVASFNATLLGLLLSLFCWAGLYLFVAQYLQLVVGLDPLQAGLWTLPSTLVSMVFCMAAPQLARRWGAPNVIISGMLMTALALVCYAVASDLAMLIAGTVCMGIGTSSTVTLGVDKVISAAPHEKAGAAAGIYETSTTFGAAMGVGLLGSMGTAVYRAAMQHTGGEARNTLGAAVEAAKRLPAAAGQALVQTARSSFLHSLHITATVAAILMLLVTLRVAWVYKKK